MRKWGLIAALSWVFCSVVLPQAPGESKNSSLWICALRTAAVPERLSRAKLPKQAPAEMVICKDGTAMEIVPAGAVIPNQVQGGQPVSVRVRDVEGKPIPGLSLEWRPEELPNLPEPFGRLVTNAKGQAEFRPPEGRTCLVWIPDPTRKAATTKVLPKTASIEILSEPLTSPFMQVKDSTGREVMGAQFSVLPWDELSGQVSAVYVPKGTRSLLADIRGRVTLPAAGKGAGGWVVAEGYELQEIPNLEEAPPVITLRASPACEIRVVDKNTQKDLGEINWTLSLNPAGISWVNLEQRGTWPQGKGWIAPSAYPCSLILSKEGYVQEEVQLESAPVQSSLKINLEPGILISGTVSDEKGLPVEGATILAGELRRPLARCVSGKNGIFHLPALRRSDAPYSILAKAHGYLDKAITPLPAANQPSLRIVLDKGSILRGRAVLQDTLQPVPGAQIAFRALRGASSQSVTFQKTADSDGAFEASGLEEGEYEVRAWAEGAVTSPLQVSVGAGQATDIGDLLLSSHPQVQGTLERSDGEPLTPAAFVKLERKLDHKEVVVATTPHLRRGRIAPDGHFVVDAVPQGMYILQVQDGAFSLTRDVRVDHDDVDVGTLVLQPSARLHGQLLGSGESFKGWRVVLLQQPFDERPPKVTADEGGFFDFGSIAPASYRLEAFPPLSMEPKAAESVTLAPGEDQDVHIPVGGVTISVFLTVDGQPASGAGIRINAPSDSHFDDTGVVILNGPGGRSVLGLPSLSASALADRAGLAILQNVPAGPSQATLYFNGMTYLRPVDIPAEATGPLSWNFNGLTLDGKVSYSDGSPAIGVLVSVQYIGLGAQPGQSVKTDGSGTFHVSGLGAGTVILVSRDERGLTGTAKITIVQEQPPPAVTLVLSKES